MKRMIRNNLPNILREKKMSQKDLAELSGLSKRTMTSVTNEENINSETMDRICNALNMDLGLVFYRDRSNNILDDSLVNNNS